MSSAAKKNIAAISDEKLTQAFKQFLSVLPHCNATKLEVVEYKDKQVSICLPAQDNTIGNKDENLVHGGAITMLIDTSCGAMAMFANETPESCPTLDLRVDHFKTAKGDAPVYCRAKLVRSTERIVFVEAFVSQNKCIIAKGTATFMRIGNENLNRALSEFFLGS